MNLRIYICTHTRIDKISTDNAITKHNTEWWGCVCDGVVRESLIFEQTSGIESCPASGPEKESLPQDWPGDCKG
jgi:hypothetical protein